MNPKKALFIQFVKYGITAGIATLFDWASYYIFYEKMGINELVSVVLSFVVWFVVNYILSVLFVFKKSKHKKGKEVALVLITSITALGVNILCVWLFAMMFGAIPLIAENSLVIEHNLIPLFAKIVSSGICMVYNFILRKVFIFAD
ncbi:MAG: GtrA family protein [Oscillospiraceae bacterium]|nr:GtrA family protein [Oscillospiraceae bacterium]